MRRFINTRHARITWPHMRCASHHNPCTPHGASSVSPLAVLGLQNDATMNDVRRAYLRLAKIHHPDCGGDAKRFALIHSAYEVCREVMPARPFTSATTPGQPPGDRSSTKSEDGVGFEQQSSDSEAPHARAQPGDKENSELWEKYRRQQQEKIHIDFVKRFRVVSCPCAIDALMCEAIASGCMTDPGEALSLALRRYHITIGYGIEHINRCFAAMDEWERLTKRRVCAHYFQELLQLYTNNDAAVRRCGAQAVVEVVTAIMDRMGEKGLEHDDLTYMLARFALQTFNSNS